MTLFCSRRKLVMGLPKVAAGVGLLSAFGPVPAWAQTSGIKTIDDFGGYGGSDAFNLTAPNTVGLWWDTDTLSSIKLNGVNYGTQREFHSREFTLRLDEYWSEFEISAGQYVNYLRLKSSRALEVAGGPGRGRDSTVTLSGMRILRIGGRTGKAVDHLSIEYIANYKPSTLREEALAILDFRPGPATIEQFKETTDAYAYAYERMTQSVVTLSISASAEAEYYGKYSLSTNYTTVDTNMTDIKNSATASSRKAEKINSQIKDGEVAVYIAAVDIMQDSEGKYFAIPSQRQTPSWVTFAPDRFNKFIGYYDFTTGAAIQLNLRTEKHYGFDRVATL